MNHQDSRLNHIIENWTYANAAAREAATGLLPADIGKVAFQSDDNTYWRLTDDSPVTWSQIGGTAGGSGIPMAGIVVTTPMSIPDDTDTNLEFDSGDVSDIPSMIDDTDPDDLLLKAPSDGIYLAEAVVEFDEHADGLRELALTWPGSLRKITMAPAPEGTTQLHLSWVLGLTEGQEVKARVKQTSGGALDVVSADLQIARLGDYYSAP